MSEGIRVSTLASQEQVRSSMSSAQNELSRITKQISSGKKADMFIGIKGDVSTENYLHVKNSLDTINARVKNNSLLQSKLGALEHAVTGIQDVTSRAKLLIQQTRDPSSGSSVDVVNIAKNHLVEIKHYLSSQFNGQYLFAGSQMDASPVGDIVNVSNVINNSPTGNYYLGNNDIAKSKISDSHVVEYGINANDPSIQKLIAGLHILIEGRTTNDPTKYAEASQLVEQANTEILPMISRVGNNMKLVESEFKKDQDSVLRLKEFVVKVEDTDTPEAMAELMAVQAQIQAAYMLLARINSTSLADYIK